MILSNPNSKVLFLLLSVLFSALSSQLSILLELQSLKYVSASISILLLIFAIYEIIKNSNSINWVIAFGLLAILYLYPMLYISKYVFINYTFKLLTDGLIIQGNYYHLILIALALSLYLDKVDYLYVFRIYLYLSYPIAILLIVTSYTSPIESAFNFGFLAINNILIPASIMLFISKKKNDIFIGYASVLLILFISSYLGSRSYMLVALYFIIASAIVLFRKNKKAILSILFISIILYFFDVFSFLNETSSLREENIIDRYKFDSLVVVIDNFFGDFNFYNLFMWEGNSRAGILVAAFGYFDTYDWLLGKGIFATYSSFIERSTIELHWAQETFRWGIIYTIFTLIVMIYVARRLKRKIVSKNNNFMYAISILIAIRILDGFVYGMPYPSVYNLLVFFGVMSLAIRRRVNVKTHY